MKKNALFITVLLFILSGTSFAQKTVTDDGFYFKVGGFSPSYKYLVPLIWENEDLEKPDENDESYKLGPYFEIGNTYKLADIDSHVLQIKVSWLDANLSKATYKWEILDKKLTKELYAVQASAFKIGPNFTYAINDKMGIEAYYQIAPVFSFWYDDSNYEAIYEDYDDNQREQYALGVLHTTGLSFRYDKFAAGFNLNFGSARDFDAAKKMDTYGGEVESYTYRMNSFRFYVGMKF
ncbi:MAG: hypothetical protein ACLFM1_09710 [Bacteroidales bacterium]